MVRSKDKLTCAICGRPLSRDEAMGAFLNQDGVVIIPALSDMAPNATWEKLEAIQQKLKSEGWKEVWVCCQSDCI